MATFYSRIIDEQADLIHNAPLFFVASADPQLAEVSHGAGPVNLSPRGGAPLHIIHPNRVAFLDFAGSAEETARHSLAGGPMTIMICSFDTEDAAIVRLYGKAHVIAAEESPLAEALLRDVALELGARPRFVIELEVERTSTSCGYGVPIMSFVRERGRGDRGGRYKARAS